jgi:hypothetical protein
MAVNFVTNPLNITNPLDYLVDNFITGGDFPADVTTKKTYVIGPISFKDSYNNRKIVNTTLSLSFIIYYERTGNNGEIIPQTVGALSAPVKLSSIIITSYNYNILTSGSENGPTKTDFREGDDCWVGLNTNDTRQLKWYATDDENILVDTANTKINSTATSYVFGPSKWLKTTYTLTPSATDSIPLSISVDLASGSDGSPLYTSPSPIRVTRDQAIIQVTKNTYDEGEYIEFTVSNTGKYTTLYWGIPGDAADFNGTPRGAFTIATPSTIYKTNLQIKKDFTTEGNETRRIVLYKTDADAKNDAKPVSSSSFTIKDTSVGTVTTPTPTPITTPIYTPTPTYTLIASVNGASSDIHLIIGEDLVIDLATVSIFVGKTFDYTATYTVNSAQGKTASFTTGPFIASAGGAIQQIVVPSSYLATNGYVPGSDGTFTVTISITDPNKTTSATIQVMYHNAIASIQLTNTNGTGNLLLNNDTLYKPTTSTVQLQYEIKAANKFKTIKGLYFKVTGNGMLYEQPFTYDANSSSWVGEKIADITIIPYGALTYEVGIYPGKVLTTMTVNVVGESVPINEGFMGMGTWHLLKNVTSLKIEAVGGGGGGGAADLKDTTSMAGSDGYPGEIVNWTANQAILKSIESITCYPGKGGGGGTGKGNASDGGNAVGGAGGTNGYGDGYGGSGGNSGDVGFSGAGGGGGACTVVKVNYFNGAEQIIIVAGGGGGGGGAGQYPASTPPRGRLDNTHNGGNGTKPSGDGGGGGGGGGGFNGDSQTTTSGGGGDGGQGGLKNTYGGNGSTGSSWWNTTNGLGDYTITQNGGKGANANPATASSGGNGYVNISGLYLK